MCESESESESESAVYTVGCAYCLSHVTVAMGGTKTTSWNSPPPTEVRG